jgi:acetylglutamate kinase
MLNHIARESTAFNAIYNGKTVAIKFGGEEIQSPDFESAAADMRALSDNGTNIIGVTGAGAQINRHYGKERKKIDGVAVTDKALMREGVLPAQAEVRERLLELMPDATVLDAEHVLCDLHSDPRFGLVGIPKHLILPDKKLTFIRSIGKVQTPEGSIDTNVNADDIARLLVEQEHDRIEELMLLTPTAGVQDIHGNIAPLLTEKRIDRILQGEDPMIKANGGMLKKLIEVRKALEHVAKVVMTKSSGLREEIERWMGSGTLCIDSKQLSVSPMRYIEEPIFEEVNATCVEQKYWRPRNETQMNELKTFHRILRVKNSPLGGMSLVPRNGWIELSALWAGCIGNGMGQLLLDSAMTEAGKRKMYALCTNQDAVNAFSAHGKFQRLGKLKKLIADGSSAIPEHLKEYQFTDRDPELFIAVMGNGRFAS